MMIYTMTIWTSITIFTVWIIHEIFRVRALSLHYKNNEASLIDEVITRSHAKLLLGLVVLWWFVYVMVGVLLVEQTTQQMNMLITGLVIMSLTPLFTYIIYCEKRRLSCKYDRKMKQTQTSWTLNILTAVIYASLINFGIQMFLMN